ncbi:PAS domain-containing protein [Halobiforma nitratireducens]|uniref:Methyl-accepting chemotaxis sensory transducer with Pas/Pac sensor n=1 Tax=Halobiforma nitratireducens JCM 10879 TaxID=1227454 RepID=M0LVY9_9EURY|nr:PAS domain-containing protein [Halobiforma nitratireducens]EMA37328.1 methyl-accepting chemotaxis sensory transducer with Pas/Pac sensor [Halobiforma nitratireducens JCM 10879]
MKELTGYESEQLVAGTISLGEDVIHDDDSDDVRNAVEDALDRRREFDIQYRIRTANGELRRIREPAHGVYDGGEVVAIEGYIWDPDSSRPTTLWTDEESNSRSKAGPPTE